MEKTVILSMILVLFGHVHCQDIMENVWTGWSEWSPCSLTCGEGIQSKQRECVGVRGNRLVRIDNPRCDGQGVEHKICSLTDCPRNQPGLREHQCRLLNKDVSSEVQHEWVPYIGGRNPCELSCISNGTGSYDSFGLVLDGTKCYKDGDKNDICVDGRCLRAGCDGVVSSGKVLDWCRKCGGNNKNCSLVRDSFKEKRPHKGNFDYKLIVKVPAGATYLEVVDKSSNYLALADASEMYLINGAWMIDLPGQYEFAGTTIMYGRNDYNETITAEGPTKEDLYIMLIFRVSNPGISFKFFIPSDKYDQVVIPKPKKHSTTYKNAIFGPQRPVLKTTTETEGKSNENDSGNNVNIHTKHDRHSSNKNLASGHYESGFKNKDEQKLKSGNRKSENDIIINNKNYGTTAPKHHGNSRFPLQDLNANKKAHHDHKTNTHHRNPVDKNRQNGNNPTEQSIPYGYDYFGLSPDVVNQIHNREKGSDRVNNHHGGQGHGRVQHDDDRRPTSLPQGYISAEEFYNSAEDENPTGSRRDESVGNQPNYVHAPVQVFTSNRYANIFGGSENAGCPSCHNYQPQIDSYCDSEFVIHGRISKIDRIDGNSRFEVNIVKAYKNLFPLATNEYIWAKGLCSCPRMKENEEYVIMGRLVPHLKTRESRLQIENQGYVKKYSTKHIARLRHMEQLCSRNN